MTSKGVDWGNKEWAARLRQEKMLNVIEKQIVGTVSLHIKKRFLSIHYKTRKWKDLC